MTEQGENRAKRLATAFYANGTDHKVKCVATDSRSYAWHHLDEAKPRWWDYRNIIPISQDLNDAIDKRRYRRIPTAIEPEILDAKAREHFRHAQFPSGYACARLGAFLLAPARPDEALAYGAQPDRALTFCAKALLQLRPISALDLAVDLLNRNVRRLFAEPQFRAELRPRSKAHLAIEIGSYFRDYGQTNEATKWCDIAARFLSEIPDPTPDDDGLKARVVQHRGISAAGSISAAGGENFQMATQLLETAAEMLADAPTYPEGKASDVLWRVRIQLRQPAADLDHCREQVNSVVELKQQGVVSPWTWAEILWTTAEQDLLRGRKNQAMDHVAEGERFFREVGVVPTAVMPCKSAEIFRERYPKDIYVIPRHPHNLLAFSRHVAWLESLLVQ